MFSSGQSGCALGTGHGAVLLVFLFCQVTGSGLVRAAGAPVSRAGFRSAGHRRAGGVQYLRLQLDLITTGTDSVWVVVASLAHKVIVNVEFSARPDGIVVTA
jgi:hypothetical protein